MNLPQCICRHDLPGPGRKYFCAHPKVHARDSVVSVEFCKACDEATQAPISGMRSFVEPVSIFSREGPCLSLGDRVGERDCPTCRGNVRLKVFECLHPWHDEVTHEECRCCEHYERRLAPGTVSRWAVGITTAPRDPETLSATLRSLVAAGWDEARLFPEPGSPIPRDFADWPVSPRTETLGAYPNWLLSLQELVLCDPQADAYFLCQDDVQLARGLRSYLERTLWPLPRIGVVSVYCSPPQILNRADGFHENHRGGRSWGALTYIFPNAAARQFLTDPDVYRHRLVGPRGGTTGIEEVVGGWCERARMPYLIHQPSLALHLGETSTLFPGARASDFRQAVAFVSEIELPVRQSIP